MSGVGKAPPPTTHPTPARRPRSSSASLPPDPAAPVGTLNVFGQLDTGELPCSSGEQRMLRLAASLADGIPVDLSDALSGLDDRNIALTVAAILHACGRRPQPPEIS